MTDYKRFTMNFKPGVYHLLCRDCPIGRHKCKIDDCKFAVTNRLGELEDKIERGELVLKKGVLKEFAAKLKSKKTVYDNGGDGDLRVAVPIECIDELLKEYEK